MRSRRKRKRRRDVVRRNYVPLIGANTILGLNRSRRRSSMHSPIVDSNTIMISGCTNPSNSGWFAHLLWLLCQSVTICSFGISGWYHRNILPHNDNPVIYMLLPLKTIYFKHETLEFAIVLITVTDPGTTSLFWLIHVNYMRMRERWSVIYFPAI